MKILPALVILASLATSPVLAQTLSPEVQALAHMLEQAQAREASELTQAFSLQAQLAAANKRADDAEAKLRLMQSDAPLK